MSSIYFDYSHPGAPRYIAECIAQMREWGITYFKVDFMRFGLESEIKQAHPHVTKVVAHDPSPTGVERFRLAELGVVDLIHERAYKNRPLGEISKRANSIKSTVRCLVEHIFGFIENSMNGPKLRYIGIVRNEAAVGLCNLAYNMKGFIQLTRHENQAAA